MSNYTITTDFGAKDSLPSSNDSKVVRGSEFTTEFTSIQTAIATKADTAGDTFTGVVNFSADVAVNTNTLFVDVSEAKVGIGTTSPQAPLHVHGDINLGNNAGADAADVEIASLNFYNRDTSGSAPNNASIIRAYSHSDTGSGGYLTFATSFGGEAEGADATEAMRIDSSGNVGIGTDSPDRALHVSTADNLPIFAESTDDLCLLGLGDNAGTVAIAASGSSFGVYTGGGVGSGTGFGTEKMRIDSTGNVGIGTTSITDKLTVYGGIKAIQSDSVNTSAIALDFDSDIARVRSTVNGTGTQRPLGFFIGGSENMRIDSSGNVGIGTTSPATALHIDSSGATALTLQRNSGASSNISIKYAAASQDYYTGVASVSEDFVIGTSVDLNGNNLLRVTSAGNIGIGTTSPSTKLHVDAGTDQIAATFHSTDAGSYINIRDNSSGTFGGLFGVEGDNIKLRPNNVDVVTIDSSGQVGIGTDSPANTLSIKGSVNQLDIETSTTGVTLESSDRADHSAQSDLSYYARHGEHKFFNSAYTQAMTIDTSGNVLVGKTDTTGNVAGVDLRATGLVVATVNNNYAGYFNRTNSDGKILDFRKDNLNVGSIGSRGGTALFIESGGTTGTAGLDIDVAIAPRNNGALSDGEIDLGTSAYRFQDLYRSGSTYSTSDRNKKQDIRDLTDAEARVATVAKGSLKAFRYIDSVEAEGDEANIHFGIIAQDLKTAFEAEGLNANDYQVFKTSTYTDDDGVEQTTYSICYENLLAFIIAAI